MYVHKGFIANNLFTSNVPGVVAKLGELSALSITFSREKGIYSNNATAPNILLTSFISKDGTTSIPVPNVIAQQILRIAQFVYAMSNQVNLTPTLLLENLITSFTGEAGNFEGGAMVTDGNNTLPEWLSWRSDVDNTRTDNVVKIWFTDEAFTTQYDEYEIYVVPPMIVLDNFFQSGPAVEQLLKSRSSAERTDLLQQAKQSYPETIIRTQTYTYFDPNNAARTVESDWSVLIYGNAGDNVDAIKDALMSYVLSNSTFTREQWIGILPDIFKRTEFIIVPLWGNYAIGGRQITVGIHSPQVKLVDAISIAKDFATLYPAAHIDSHLTTMGHPYKSLALLCIGSPDNRDNLFELTDVFPDLISVTSTSVDFNRMEQGTQDWATMLAEMLYAAEEMGDFTTVPVGMMKLRRANRLYLAKSFKNINYLLAAKLNFDA